MSRRRIALPDCLELLLDTICNTFGAVIFISILLSVFVDEKPSAVDVEGMSQKVEQLISQRESDLTLAKLKHDALKSQIEQQQKILNQFSNPDSLRLAREIQQSSEERVRLLAEKSQMVEVITAAEAKSMRMEVEIQSRAELKKQLADQLAQLRAEMERVASQEGRTARISKLRMTRKSGFVYMMHDQRLYQVVLPSGKLNPDDCTETKQDDSLKITPRADGGLILPAQQQQLDARFKFLKPESQFVRLFVSPNTFAQFVTVKDRLVDMGIEYEVIILEDNRAELFVTSEAGESYVQ